MLGCIYLLYSLDAGYAWYIAMLIAPDISMLGDLGGNKVGAISYNLFHHKGIGVATALAGIFTSFDWLVFAGIVIIGHASQDRILGYGLKYFSGFKFTHLGKIGWVDNTD